MTKPRLYLDTSVIGGCFDPELAAASNALLAHARTGRVTLLLSDLLAASNAPIAHLWQSITHPAKWRKTA